MDDDNVWYATAALIRAILSRLWNVAVWWRRGHGDVGGDGGRTDDSAFGRRLARRT